jgi:ATP-binding cassette, subfamily C, bacterial
MLEPTIRGLQELRAARRANRTLFVWAAVFSVAVNMLMLTSPLYMLQVYDRVLGSRSEETLVALSVLVLALFLIMGVLDYLRSRVMSVAAARFQDNLDRRVFAASMRRSLAMPNDAAAFAAQRDLEAVQRCLASPVFLALFDMPWTPFYLAILFVFHPFMGWLAVAGGGVLVLVTLANRIVTRKRQTQASLSSMRSERLSDQLKGESEVVQALGMTETGFDKWQASRREALRESIWVADRTGLFGAMSKTFRHFLQSAMLGLGAWLVLQGELTAGAMIAGSILMGRAMAPVEMAIAQWAVVTRAQEGWQRLAELLSHMPPEPPRTALPRPPALLEVENLSVVPPGDSVPVLRMLSFRVEPGQALGVIGHSGSGKSSVARAITGIWRPTAGTIRLGRATLDQYDTDVLGRYIGYLPQRVSLFDGTIAENIARLGVSNPPEAIVAAAQRAAAHNMIVQFPQGYDTPVSAIGGRLSGGQIQRIGLARALYGEPILLVLDEPNSNLDNEGSEALNAAIRSMKAAGRSVLIMAHRPAAIQECDMLLVLDNGVRSAFGPRDQVLRDMVRNHVEIVRAGAAEVS